MAKGETGSAICVYVCVCYFFSFLFFFSSLFTCSPVSAINSKSLQTCRDNGPGGLHGSPGGKRVAEGRDTLGDGRAISRGGFAASWLLTINTAPGDVEKVRLQLIN